MISIKKILLTTILSFLLLVSLVSATDFTTNNVAWYGMENTTTSLFYPLYDNSLNEYNLTNYGATFLNTSGTSGFDFDGTNDYLDVPFTNFSSDTQGSISLWFNTDDITTARTLWGSGDEASGTRFFYVTTGGSGYVGEIRVINYDEGYNYELTTSGEPLSASVNNHLVISSDDSTIKLYLNGIEETLSITNGANNGAWFGDVPELDNFHIGVLEYNSGTFADYYDGKVYSTSVFDTALDSTEVSELYAEGINFNPYESSAPATNYTNLSISANLNNFSAYITGSDIPDYRECYQEFANVSTSCGGLDSGSYDVSEFSNGYLMIDGDYDTYKTATNPNGCYYWYVNYTIPQGTVSAKSLNKARIVKFWCKDDSSSWDSVAFDYYDKYENYTIPSDCLTSDTLELRYETCLFSPEGNFYEEGIYWNITGGVYETTTGTIDTPIPSNSTSLYNITLVPDDYYYDNLTYYDYNVSTNINGVFVRQLALITVSAYDLLGNVVDSFNLTSGYETNSTGSVLVEHQANASINWTKSGWYDSLDNYIGEVTGDRAININELYNQIINITVKNKVNGSTVQNWSAEVTENLPQSISTTSGYYELYAVKNYDYNITLDLITGYSDYNSSALINNDSMSYSYEFELFTYNSINYSIYELGTEDFIEQEVNITMISPDRDYYFTTSDGYLYVDDILDGTYFVTVETNNYSLSRQTVTVESNSYQRVDFYLTTAELVSKTFTVEAKIDGSPVSDALVVFNTIINGTSVVVTSERTDFTGTVVVELDEELTYVITVTADGFETFTGSIQPNTAGPFSIILSSEGTEPVATNFDNADYEVSFSYETNATYAIMTIIASSHTGSLQYYGYSFDYNGVTYSQNVTGNPTGGTITVNITNINLTAQEAITASFYMRTVGDREVAWQDNYFLTDNEGSDISITGGLFDNIAGSSSSSNPIKAIIAIFLVLFPIIIFSSASRDITVGATGGLGGLAVVWYFGFWPTNLCIISMIALIVVIIADNTRGF